MAGLDLSKGVTDADIADGAMIVGQLGEDEVLLVRRGDEVFAVGAACTHYHGPLGEGLLVGDTIRCPWHHACFDLRTGNVLRAPAPAPIPAWRVEKIGDRWFVRERVEQKGPAEAGAPQRVVIIGAGPAGVFCADTLRREGFDGPIILISSENDLPYDKPNLSKDYLAGNAPPEWLPLHTQEDYDSNKIELRLGVTATAVDTKSKEVSLSSGEKIGYDSLVLATGSVVKKLEDPRIRYLRTRRDAEALVSSAVAGSKAIVIGPSFIALEVAASLRQRSLDVTVITRGQVPLEKVLGVEVGNRVKAIHEEHGVKFVREHPLDDADLIVAGIGVMPNVDLARAAGLTIDNGVVVDEFFETSIKGVYACGDIARWPEGRVEHWVVAGRQGQTVARNILGKRQRFDSVPFFWSAHYDVQISYVGFARWDRVEIHGSLHANDATIVYRRGSEITAVATIFRDRVSLEVELAMERGDLGAVERLVAAR